MRPRVSVVDIPAAMSSKTGVKGEFVPQLDEGTGMASSLGPVSDAMIYYSRWRG